MGGTTSNGIPYPTGTDRVADGDNAMQAMAEALNPFAGVTTGTITYAAGVADAAGTRLVRVGRLVWINLAFIRNAQIAAGGTIATIPAAFQPVDFAAMTAIMTDGTVYMVVPRSDGRITTERTMPIGPGTYCSTTYLAKP